MSLVLEIGGYKDPPLSPRTNAVAEIDTKTSSTSIVTCRFNVQGGLDRQKIE